MKATVAYAHDQWRRDPGKVVCPLPVSVFNWRITDSTFGFFSHKDREQAQRELFAQFSSATHARLHADGSVTTPCLTFVAYRDTHAVFAAQVIVWLPNQRGGFHFASSRFLVGSISRKIAATLIRRG